MAIIFCETFISIFSVKLLFETFMWNFCVKLLCETFIWNFINLPNVHFVAELEVVHIKDVRYFRIFSYTWSLTLAGVRPLSLCDPLGKLCASQYVSCRNFLSLRLCSKNSELNKMAPHIPSLELKIVQFSCPNLK